MGEQMNRAEMLKHMEEIENSLRKSQLIKPPLTNSERESWAGSSWSEEQDDTKSTPGGTDWNPKNTKVFKNIDQMSEEEILRHLEMRKSRMPNPIAAEAEILSSVEGVEKAICPKCDGMQKDVMTKSTCNQCNGFGYVWMVPNKEAGQMIKAIEAKWNVTKAMPGPKGQNKQAAMPDASPTNPDTDPTEKPESVGPASSAPVSKAQEIKAALNKAKKGIEDLLAMDEGGKKKRKRGSDEDEEQDEDVLMEEDEDKDEEKCVKGIDNDVLARSLQLALTSVGSLASQVEELGKSIGQIFAYQHEQADLLHNLAQSHMDVAKSIMSEEEQGAPRAARPPKASGPGVNNVRVLQKSFVDSAPGQNVTQQGSGEEDYVSRYDLQTLKKGATKMVLAGKMDRRIGTRLDVGTLPEAKILKSLDKFIDEHGVEDDPNL